MHIKAAGAVAPRVPVRSKADHFERDGAEQRQNTWQNRDLRPILPLEPTGLDGTHPQPPAFPVDLLRRGSCLTLTCNFGSPWRFFVLWLVLVVVAVVLDAEAGDLASELSSESELSEDDEALRRSMTFGFDVGITLRD